MRCRRCHGVYQHPTAIPLGNPYDDHAPEHYFSRHDEEAKILTGEDLAEQARRLQNRTGRMLEVGCGRGELLRGARNRGWECAGIELTAAYADYATRVHGLLVERADALVARCFEEPWDVVLFAATLEHLYEPIPVLRRAFSALVPGGLLYLDVPNECSLYTRIGNLYERLRGRDWAVNLSPTFSPFHVVGFCPTSLRRALNDVGFEVLDLQGYSMEHSLAGRTGGWMAAIERHASRYVLRFGHAIGMSAGLLCWARRPAK